MGGGCSARIYIRLTVIHYILTRLNEELGPLLLFLFLASGSICSQVVLGIYGSPIGAVHVGFLELIVGDPTATHLFNLVPFIL